jgi:hypothetical protein
MVLYPLLATLGPGEHVDHGGPADPIPVYSTVQPPAPPADVRPVLIAFLGSRAHRQVAIARVLPGLGDAVVLSLPKGHPLAAARATHRELSAHLAAGSWVLVNAGNGARSARRALLDAAARHWAATLAVVCGTALVAGTGEGWHAVLLVTR